MKNGTNILNYYNHLIYIRHISNSIINIKKCLAHMNHLMWGHKVITVIELRILLLVLCHVH